MLIISNKYESLDAVLNHKKLITETKDSDLFESRCARYLRSLFGNHKFSVKGGDDRTVSDILVDDTFYIECKMTENDGKRNGAQCTGFGITQNRNKFICSNTAEDSEQAEHMLDYMNSHFSEFKKVVEPHTGTSDLFIDESIFAEYISDYYIKKNALYFITSFEDEFVVFKNTPKNLLKYFTITATARYYQYGTKNLPISQRDEAERAIKKQYNVSSVKYDDNHTFVKIKDLVEDPYINDGDLHFYLSSKNQKQDEYRVMKLSNLGCARVLFLLRSKRSQDKKDLDEFRRYINSI